jgi:hypothetical protein
MAFDLKKLMKKTLLMRAPLMVVSGQGKIGKTTFAASAPSPIGILTEDGASAVDAVAFPLCRTYEDVQACVDALLNEEHEFQTVFIDSLDWLEPMIHAYVCGKNKWASIEAAGYGKGYIAAADEWRQMLLRLTELRDKRNMGVILICHDKVKHFESPLHDGYDQYTLKLHDRATALVSEWADVIGWCSHQVITSESDAGYGTKETKARTTGKRILHVEPHPAHPGGNRFGLKNMPLDWAAFQAALAATHQA